MDPPTSTNSFLLPHRVEQRAIKDLAPNERNKVQNLIELEALKVGIMAPESQSRFFAKDWVALAKFWEYKELRCVLPGAKVLELTGIEANRVLESTGQAMPFIEEKTEEKIRRADKVFDVKGDESTPENKKRTGDIEKVRFSFHL